MKRRKLVALMLVVAMSLTLLSGCGKDDVTTGGETDGESFTLFVDGGRTTDDWYLMPVLEEQTGIKVDVEFYPYEVASEKYSLALNSGEYADVIGGWVLSQTDILKYGMDMGMYIPLEDLIAEHAPNIEAILNLEGVRETMTAPDGHIYSIPYVLSAPEVDFNPYINTRWLEAVGMEIPTTTEELTKVLRAFKEQDANGNGNPNDEIPFSFDPNNTRFGYYAGWWGFPINKEFFGMKDGELEFGATGEEYKSMIKYFRSLYGENLMDPETFTQDQAQWKAKGSTDIYGVCMMYGSGDIEPFEAGETPDWVPLPVLKTDMTDNPIWFRDTYGTTVIKNQVVITDKAKNPEAIIRWWDNMFELENSIQANAGPLGIKIFKEGDDYVIDESNLTEEEKDTYAWANIYPQSLPRYVPTDFKFKERVEIFKEKDNVSRVYKDNLAEHRVPSYWATAEQSAKLSDYQTAIQDYITEQTAQWIAGQGDVDADWAAYEAQLEKLKLEEYVQMRKDAIK